MSQCDDKIISIINGCYDLLKLMRSSNKLYWIENFRVSMKRNANRSVYKMLVRCNFLIHLYKCDPISEYKSWEISKLASPTNMKQ